MTAIPHAAGALTSALGRFDRASMRVIEAATGAGKADLGAALADTMVAKVEAVAAISVVRFSDEMWKALLELNRHPPED